MTGTKFPRPPGEPTPDWEDVRQEEESVVHSVPVDVQGIVPVWALPAKRSTVNAVSVDTLVVIPNPNELIPADPRVRRAQVVSGIPFTLGTMEQLLNKVGFTVPANTILTMEGFEESIHVVGSAAGVVSVRFEYWSD